MAGHLKVTTPPRADRPAAPQRRALRDGRRGRQARRQGGHRRESPRRSRAWASSASRVAGHTDSEPINQRQPRNKFPSNWELLGRPPRHCRREAPWWPTGVAPGVLSAAGYGPLRSRGLEPRRRTASPRTGASRITPRAQRGRPWSPQPRAADKTEKEVVAPAFQDARARLLNPGAPALRSQGRRPCRPPKNEARPHRPRERSTRRWGALPDRTSTRAIGLAARRRGGRGHPWSRCRSSSSAAIRPEDLGAMARVRRPRSGSSSARFAPRDGDGWGWRVPRWGLVVVRGSSPLQNVGRAGPPPGQVWGLRPEGEAPGSTTSSTRPRTLAARARPGLYDTLGGVPLRGPRLSELDFGNRRPRGPARTAGPPNGPRCGRRSYAGAEVVLKPERLSVPPSASPRRAAR